MTRQHESARLITEAEAVKERLGHNLMEQKELQLEEERLTQRLAMIEFNFETVNPGVGWGRS